MGARISNGMIQMGGDGIIKDCCCSGGNCYHGYYNCLGASVSGVLNTTFRVDFQLSASVDWDTSCNDIDEINVRYFAILNCWEDPRTFLLLSGTGYREIKSVISDPFYASDDGFACIDDGSCYISHSGVWVSGTSFPFPTLYNFQFMSRDTPVYIADLIMLSLANYTSAEGYRAFPYFAQPFTYSCVGTTGYVEYETFCPDTMTWATDHSSSGGWLTYTITNPCGPTFPFDCVVQYPAAGSCTATWQITQL